MQLPQPNSELKNMEPLFDLHYAMIPEFQCLLRIGPLSRGIVREVLRLPSHNFICGGVRGSVYSTSWVALPQLGIYIEFLFRLAS